MANSEEVTDWKKKYETLKEENNKLKMLAAKAIDEFEDLQTKYSENIEQYEDVKNRLNTADEKLQNLQSVLEPACDEFNQLNEKLEIEKYCRTEAEVMASKFYKHNVSLKRQSQLLIKLVEDANIPVGELTDIGEDENMEAFSLERDSLNRKIVALEAEVKSLEDKLDKSESDRLAELEEKQQLDLQRKELKNNLDKALERGSNYEEQIKSLDEVYDMAWNDYEELREKYDRLVQLNHEAVVYANKMLTERDVIVRQSSILLSSASSDQRLIEALQEIDSLTKQLKLDEEAHASKVLMLEQTLAESADASKINDLDLKLQLATKEIEILQKSYSDLEKSYNELDKWKVKLERENLVLINELDVAQQKLRPAPPPPPPPPPPLALIRPFRMLMKKKDEPSSNLTRAGKPKDKAYEDALTEMMERIKHGQTLKPAANRPRPVVQEKREPSAMLELHNVLKGMKKVNQSLTKEQ